MAMLYLYHYSLVFKEADSIQYSCTWEGWGCSISQRCRGRTPVSAWDWCTGNHCWCESVSSRKPAPLTWTAGSPEFKNLWKWDEASTSNLKWKTRDCKSLIQIYITSGAVASEVKMYLVIHNALNPSAGEIETVTKCKITAHWWFGATASEFL